MDLLDDDYEDSGVLNESNGLQDSAHDTDPLEAQVIQIVTELLSVGDDGTFPDGDESSSIRSLNWLSEILEKAEARFRQSSPTATRRDGHLIGHLLRILDDFEDFHPMLERKLQAESADRSNNERMNAAVCRLILATVPTNKRSIIRIMYEEDVLDRICRWADSSSFVPENGHPTPLNTLQLQCYATGLLSIGLQDRSVADIVVNHATLPSNILRRIRLYAMKLEKEHAAATEFIQKSKTTKQHKKSTTNNNAPTPLKKCKTVSEKQQQQSQAISRMNLNHFAGMCPH
jgi:HIV-1 Vpr-binding protein